MKKILQAYKEYYPSRGGVITSMMNIIEATKDKCKNIVICTRKGRINSNPVYNETVVRCKSFGNLLSLPISPSYMWGLFKQIQKVDVVIHHFPMPLNDLILSVFLPRKTKLIIFWHSDIVEKKQKLFALLLSPFINIVLKRADKILVNNPLLVEESKQISKHKSKVAISPFGIKPENLQLKTSKEKASLVKVEKNYGKFFLSIGRLVNYKGYEYLINAVKGTDFKVVIIGEGVLREKLERLVKKYKLTEQVIFKGDCTEQDVKLFLNACRGLLLPSITKNETFAIVQIEAMVLGKPIINSNLNNGVNWVARHNKEALTVQPKDVQELSDAMSKLWRDDKLVKKLGNAGKKRCEELFSFDKFTELMRSILN